jgi:hypothetical protein
MPLDSTLTILYLAALPKGKPLTIPGPSMEIATCIPHAPLLKSINNPHARETHSYSLVDDLDQFPVAMPILEVL